MAIEINSSTGITAGASVVSAAASKIIKENIISGFGGSSEFATDAGDDMSIRTAPRGSIESRRRRT